MAGNAVTRIGHGKPMVLVHGFGCDQNMWERVAPDLAKEYSVIMYDLTGMGASDYSRYDENRHGSLEGHADDLLELIADENEPVIAVGHSVSAMIVALAAIKQPEKFAKLVMVGANPCYTNDAEYHGGFEHADIEGLLASMRDNYLGWAGQLAGMVAGEQSDGAPEDELKTRFCKNDPAISRHFARVTFTSDNRNDLPKISHPTLLLQCRNDIISPPEVSQFLLQKISESHLLELNANGHAPHMTRPAETVEAILAFAR